MALLRKFFDQLTIEITPNLPYQTVGKFTGPYPADGFFSKQPFQFFQQIIFIYKILEQGGMKIGLQDAIGTIHIAKGTEVQNFITAALIGTRTRALSDERPSVLRYVKGLFPGMNRIIGTKKRMKHFLWIRDNLRRNLQSILDRADFRVIKNLRVN